MKEIKIEQKKIFEPRRNKMKQIEVKIKIEFCAFDVQN